MPVSICTNAEPLAEECVLVNVAGKVPFRLLRQHLILGAKRSTPATNITPDSRSPTGIVLMLPRHEPKHLPQP